MSNTITKVMNISGQKIPVECNPKNIYWRLMASYTDNSIYILDDGDMDFISGQVACGVFTGYFNESPDDEIDEVEYTEEF
jgi:hypothetical protein